MKRSELAVGLALNEKGQVVYGGTDRRVPFCVRLRNGCGCSYYAIKGYYLRSELLEKALQTGDLSILDAPLPRAKPHPNKRDLEILSMRKQGATYRAIATHYGLTPQRVHNIIKRLASIGLT